MSAAPINYYGGKAYMLKHLLPLIPAHTHYLEVFGGGARLLFAKSPSLLETYNDVDGGLVNFFRVLRDPGTFPEFLRRAAMVPYSREEYYQFRAHWAESEDPIERAVQWFFVARASFSGNWGSSWACCKNVARSGMSMAVSKWLGSVERLPETHERLRRVQIENRDFETVVAVNDDPEAFFYLDPPYVLGTRNKQHRYACEMDDVAHARLVAQVQTLQGKVLLSGYDHPLYAPLDASGWSKREFQVPCYAAARTRATGLQGALALQARHIRTEVVWANYPLPASDPLVDSRPVVSTDAEGQIWRQERLFAAEATHANG